MNTLTALIPFYNEERTIGELVQQLSALPKGTLSNCIFIDDGSKDSSLKILEAALRRADFNFEIIKKENGGKASAIQEGVRALTTSHAVILDSDLELAPSDIEKLWGVVEAGKSDFVFGYRVFLAQSSFTYRYSRGNQLISNIYGVLFNEVISDIMCGYKLLPSKVLQALSFRYKHFGLEIEIPMHMWRYRQRPYEVQVSYRARTRVQGKSISVKDAVAVISSMIVFRFTNRRIKA